VSDLAQWPSDVIAIDRPRPDRGTSGSTQPGEAIEMVLSVDIHRIEFITGSAKDQSDTG